ncbi:hypothetical protein Aduo_018336 [Ancylostoma duodenale]
MGWRDKVGIILELRLIANQILEDILNSKTGKFTRMLEICSSRELPKIKIRVALRNTTKWDMNGPQPFATVSSDEFVMDYQCRSRDNVFQLTTSFYRFLLQNVTHPAYRIQEYAIRKNGRGERYGSRLPRNIEMMPLKFLEYLIGYRTEEPQGGDKCGERLPYRADMFKALQAALRDIRSYGYGYMMCGGEIHSKQCELQFKIPSPKKAEPNTTRIVEDNDED